MLNACSAILVLAIAAAIIQVTGHRFDIRWFAFDAVIYTGFSTLTRHLRTRRRRTWS